MADEENRSRGRGRGRAKLPQAQTGQQATAGPAQTGLPGRASTSRGIRNVTGDSGALVSSMRGLTMQETKPSVLSAGGQELRNNDQRSDFSLVTQQIFQPPPHVEEYWQRDPSAERQFGRGSLRGNRAIERAPLLRTRPETCKSKLGTTGKPVNLTSNYFEIVTKADWHLYQYRVDFDPEEDRTIIRRALLGIHRPKLGGAYVFDGTMLFTHQRLSSDPLTLVSQRTHDNAPITLTVRSVDHGAIKLGDQTYLQVFNIVIRKCLKNLNLTLLNRNYFDPEAKIVIPEFQLELWPGYLTSMRQHEHSFLLCAEIIHKVLRQDKALDVLRQCAQRQGQDYRESFKTEIIGQVVLTMYGNTATYKVDDVDFDSNPDSTFDMKGQRVSYREYYKNKYGINITDSRQPMLVSRPKARDERGGQSTPIYLVPELCRMTGITDQMRENVQLMRAMADRTRMDARTRQERLAMFERRFSGTQKNQEELGQWNLKLSNKLVSIKGRVLTSEKIIFGRQQVVALESVPDWTNSFRNTTMLSSTNLQDWACIFLSRNGRDVEGFIDCVRKAGKGMGFSIASPKMFNMNDDRVNSCVQTLDMVMSRSMPQMIMFVVSNNRADRYSAIKRKTYVDRAVPCQVVTAKTVTRKGLMSIATKVAIQMSCKIGGSPWTVDVPLKGTMVVGFDVSHDAKQKSKSFGALVASLNSSWTRYFSSVTPHQHGEEIFNDLPLNILKAITKYQKHNDNAIPTRILIYRDGVGESQINKVVTKEVEDVLKALQSTYGDHAPKMSFIIVTKRINSRFFMGHENPPAGTVVDDVVTCPEKYDFFLVSQSVRQGTVSPTGFNVIYDKSGLDADKIQRLSYKLCHLYFNWSGTVRVPAPCQYAHKLAFMCSQHLHCVPNGELDDLLYYL